MSDWSPITDPGSRPVQHVDPGSTPARTHPATGTFGRPVESGGSHSWGPSGDDGTIGGSGTNAGTPGEIGDGTGTR